MNRYWVGGTGTWNASDTTHWSASSGGASGASVPTSSDNVFFDANSGAGTATTGAAVACLNFDATGYAGNLAANSFAISVYGDFVNGSTMAFNTRLFTFAATSAGKTVSFGANMSVTRLTFAGVGGGWTFSNSTSSGGVHGITLTNGALDFNGQSVTIGTQGFSFSGSSTRTLTLGAAAITCATCNVTATTTTNLTFSGASSTITMTGTATFAGGGLTYGTLTIGGTTGTTTISGNNTFATLSVTATGARTLKLTDSSTQTIGTWSGGGASPGSPLTLTNTASAAQATIVSSSGNETITNAVISWIAGSPANNWAAAVSTDAGNNTGIAFGNLGSNLFFGSNF